MILTIVMITFFEFIYAGAGSRAVDCPKGTTKNKMLNKIQCITKNEFKTIDIPELEYYFDIHDNIVQKNTQKTTTHYQYDNRLKRSEVSYRKDGLITDYQGLLYDLPVAITYDKQGRISKIIQKNGGADNEAQECHYGEGLVNTTNTSENDCLKIEAIIRQLNKVALKDGKHLSIINRLDYMCPSYMGNDESLPSFLSLEKQEIIRGNFDSDKCGSSDNQYAQEVHWYPHCRRSVCVRRRLKHVDGVCRPSDTIEFDTKGLDNNYDHIHGCGDIRIYKVTPQNVWFSGLREHLCHEVDAYTLGKKYKKLADPSKCGLDKKLVDTKRIYDLRGDSKSHHQSSDTSGATSGHGATDN
jgi:hypothetical protein